MIFFFFFQAEDGIRDIGVTGVQTCALPILLPIRLTSTCSSKRKVYFTSRRLKGGTSDWRWPQCGHRCRTSRYTKKLGLPHRSEERRVGKECRSRWGAYH